MNIREEFTQMLDWDSLESQSETLFDKFNNASPFSHISLDNYFNEDYLDMLIKEFDATDWSKQDVRNDQGIQVKLRSNWEDDNEIPPTAFKFISLLNSGNFLRVLSKITGVEGLIPDPYLSGGGLNQINTGGHLAVHADGNWHDKMGVHRRLNVILYLNKDWDSEWGGNFELWNKDITKCEKEIAPLFNRLMIFKTDDFSFHGHPKPLNVPQDRSRRSLILYYYTNTRPESELASDEKHRAIFHKTY